MMNDIKLNIFEVLQKVAATKKKEEKIALLRKHDSFALKSVIQGCYNSNIKLLLPEGDPPYTACDPHNCPSNLLRKARDFAYFVGQKGKNIRPIKRETIFINLLEGIHPEDAKIVLQMKNKKPFKGISAALVKEVYPNLMPPD
jgi:hypothetical protein